MNIDSIVLLTKDAFCADYLPCYGNLYWKGKTPNIDELANQGIVYTRFYTAAPSSAMAYLSMFTGHYPHELDIATFEPLKHSYDGDTLFDKANALGFQTHVMWDKGWMSGAYKYSLCYGKNTTMHVMDDLGQSVGAQFVHEGVLQPNEDKSRNVLGTIDSELQTMTQSNSKIFLWFHVPHVINGRVCYGSDMDIFDQIVGLLRQYFSDNNIFISADHGNMNGYKGKLGYGFDVHDSAVRIPLISPVKPNSVSADSLLCNIDFFSILFGGKIPLREFVYSDSAYYGQPNRELGIIHGKYKYIYNKRKNEEYLYDIEYDPTERFNLIADSIFDNDRGVQLPSREEFLYPFWDELPEIRAKLKNEKKRIWKESTIKQKFIGWLKIKTRPFRERMIIWKKKKMYCKEQRKGNAK